MPTRGPRPLALLLAVPALALAACTGGVPASGTVSPATPPSAAAPSPTATSAQCPNPEGGSCLGTLAAGTYTSSTFAPALTYTVPDGWQNVEDVDGSFTLLPPGGSFDDYLNGQGDSLTVLADTYAARESCDFGPAAGVARSADGIVGYLKQRTSLQVSEPQPTQLGGFTGVSVDLTLVPANVLTCLAPDRWDPALFAPAGESSVVAGPSENELVRVFLLDHDGQVTTVDLDAFGGPADPLLDDLQSIAESITFAASGTASTTVLLR